MIELIIAAVVGIVVGWNLPQPTWAKNLQDKIVAKIKRK